MRVLIISLSMVLIFFSSRLSAGGGLPFEIEEGFLIHVSRHMIKASKAIPGMETQFGIMDSSEVPDPRCTLHHCYHGMVPDSAMGFKSWSLFSINPSDIGTNEGRKYAWLDEFKNFKGHIYGGQLHDIYTGPHHYGQGSIVIVPEEEKELFNMNNPDFEGEIVLYRKDEKLRDVIEVILQKKKKALITYEQKDPAPNGSALSDYTLSLGKQHLDEEPFLDFFKKAGLYVGNHNYSPFGNFEIIWFALRNPFILLSQKPAEVWPSILPERHLQVLCSLYPFLKNDLVRSAGHAMPQLEDGLKVWLANCDSFMNLWHLELKLRKAKKSLFHNNPHLKDHIQRRADLRLEELSDLPCLTKEAEEMSTRSFFGDPTMGFVPEYMFKFLSESPPYFRRLAKDSSLSSEEKVAYQLVSLFRLYKKMGKLEDSLVEALVVALEDLTKCKNPSKDFLPYVRSEFWNTCVEDESPQGERVLALFNSPRLAHNLQALLLRPGALDLRVLSKDQVIDISKQPRHEAYAYACKTYPQLLVRTFDYLLQHSDRFKDLYGPQGDSFEPLLCLKKLVLEKKPETIREALRNVSFYRGRWDECYRDELSFVNFCGKVLDEHLQTHPPLRALSMIEKGILITDIQRHLCFMKIQGLLASAALEQDVKVDEGEVSKNVPLRKCLEQKVKVLTEREAAKDTPSKILDSLRSRDIEVLPFIRAGGFGGLQGVAVACGLGEQFLEAFDSDQEAAWHKKCNHIEKPTLGELLRFLKYGY